MANLLLIQPDSGRQRLLAALQASGRDYYQHSFIDVQPIATQAVELDSYQGVIWVSKNAVRYAQQAGYRVLGNRAMYAVGPGTARAAANAFKLPCQCPTMEHASEPLLAFTELADCPSQRWAIIKGVGGRELLADTLTARGAQVDTFAVYQRIKRPLTEPQQIDVWRHNVSTIAVTSAEQLSYFLSELPANYHRWLASCHWVVPSERLSQLIPFANSHNITITQSASENAMINALTSMDNDYDR